MTIEIYVFSDLTLTLANYFSQCKSIKQEIKHESCIGGSRGGVTGAHPPPSKGPDSFVLTYKIF